MRSILLSAALCVLSCQPAWADESSLCASPKVDEWVAIRHVIDGDTVVAADGRRLRLIGIDTPEMGRDGRPSEAYSEKARDALRALLKGQTVAGLYHDVEPRDKYRRHLVHLFLKDGANIQARLLREGMAISFARSPNLKYLDCYLHAEAEAFKARRGIWGLPQYQPVDVSELNKRSLGFRVIRGRVSLVERDLFSIWIHFEAKEPNVVAQIRRGDLPLFNGVDLAGLNGRQVIARGRIDRNRRTLRMQIRHPGHLEEIPW